MICAAVATRYVVMYLQAVCAVTEGAPEPVPLIDRAAHLLIYSGQHRVCVLRHFDTSFLPLSHGTDLGAHERKDGHTDNPRRDFKSVWPRVYPCAM